MTATVELTHLLVRVVATVQYGWTHARPVAEFLRLLEDLRGQLARRSKDQSERILLAPVHRPVGRRGRNTVLVHLVQDRYQEGSRLARARLGAGHQIAPGQNDRNGVLLHRRRFIVARQLDVVINDLCQLDIVEGINVSRHVVTRRLHGNIFVLAEIDTGVAVFEQLALQPLIALRELCVVHLTAAHSATIAAATSGSSASIRSTGPATPSRSATSTAVRSTIVESTITASTAGTNSTVFSSDRWLLRISARFGPTIVASRRRWRTSIWRSATAVRRPVVTSSPAVTTIIVKASPVTTALEASVASSSVEAITTAPAVAVVTAATIVLIAASTAASVASIEVSAPVVVIAAIVVAPVVATTAAITIRIATETASTATAAAYSTAGTGVSR
uniref:Putative carbohydrate binding protein n=1 Tax=Anopheles darlingi TaxID=43151 RepID=A0A2M4D1U2_ANODA